MGRRWVSLFACLEAPADNVALLPVVRTRTTFQAHQNAIFDLAWSQNDRTIVRSSASLVFSAADHIPRRLRPAVTKLSSCGTARPRLA